MSSFYGRILDPRFLARGALEGAIEGVPVNPLLGPDRFEVVRLEASGDPCVLEAPHWRPGNGGLWRVVRSFRAVLPGRAGQEAARQPLLFLAFGVRVRDAIVLTVDIPPVLGTVEALFRAWPAEAKGLFASQRTLARARLAAGDRRFDRSCLISGAVALAVATPPGWHIPARTAWRWALWQVRRGLPADKAVRWLAGARHPRDLGALAVMAALA